MYHFKFQYFLFVFILVSNYIWSQKYIGPAGVGSGDQNRYWFDANAIPSGSNMQFWDNKGGRKDTNLRQNDANLRPTLNASGGPNSQAQVEFSGTYPNGPDAQYFGFGSNPNQVPDINNNGPWNERTYIITFSTGTDVTSAQMLFEEGGLQNGLHLYIRNGELFFGGFNKSNNGIASPWGGTPIRLSTALSVNTSYILTIVYNHDGNDNFNGTFTGFLNNSQFQQETGVGIIYNHANSTQLGANGNNLIVGETNTHLLPFNGAVQEFMLFNKALNNSERILINNYLSAKYNISLSANDEYVYDDAMNGNFDFGVIGAKRINATDNSVNINYGNGFIRFDNISPLSDGDFIYAGSNLKDQTAVTPVCQAGDEVLLSNSVWRFQTSGGTFTGDLILDTSLFGSSLILDVSDFKIIFDDAPDFISPTASQVATSINGSEVTFSNISINDGDFFRFRYNVRDANAPAGLLLNDELKFQFEANAINQEDGTDVLVWNNQGSNTESGLNSGITPLPADVVPTNPPSLDYYAINDNASLVFDEDNDESLEIDATGGNTGSNDINLNGPYSQRTFSFVFKTSGRIFDRQIIFEEGAFGAGASFYLFEDNFYFSMWNTSGNTSNGGGWDVRFLNAPVTVNSTYVITAVFNGSDQRSGTPEEYEGNIELFVNGESVGTLGDVGLLLNHTGDVNFGENGSETRQEDNTKLAAGFPKYFNGQIAEFLIYDKALSTDEIDLINNALMAKYGVTPNANDIYAYDTNAEGDFDYNLLGIRQTAESDFNGTNYGTGILQIINPSDLDAGEQLVVASNTNDQSIFNAEDYDCTNTSADDVKLQSVWRANVVGNPGTVDLRFDINKIDIPPSAITDLVLLIDNDADFSSPEFSQNAAILCESALWSSITLNNGDYFTIRREAIEAVIWDGSQFINGSGVSNQPGMSDVSRKFIVDGPGATIDADFGCACLGVLPSSDLSVNNSKTNIKGNVIQQSILNSSTADFHFTGEGLQTVSGNAFEANRIFIDNGESVNFNLNTNDTIKLNASLKMKRGQLNANGDLVFRSIENSMTSDPVETITAYVEPVENNAAIIGDVVVERRIPQSNRAYRYIASPVNTSGTIRENLQEGQNNPDTSTNFNNVPGFGTHITGSTMGNNGFDATETGNPSMFNWDPSGNPQVGWTAILNTDNKPLYVGEAYALIIRGGRATNLNSNTDIGPGTTLRFTGEMHTGDFEVPNQFFSTQDGFFNLIANPYQSPVNLKALLQSNDASDVSNTVFYIYDPTIGTVGGYATIDIDNDNYSGEDLTGTPFTTQANQYLQPNQAFFVATVDSNLDTNFEPEITFKEQYKQEEILTTGTFSVETNLMSTIDINLKRTNANIVVDGVTLKLNDNYADAVDYKDAGKAWNLQESIAFVQDGNYLSINKKALPVVNDTIQLLNHNYQENNYTLEIYPENLNLPLTAIYLKDNYLNSLTLINQNSFSTYNFTVDHSIPESNDAMRFQIIFDVETLNQENFDDRKNFSIYPNPVTDQSFQISTPYPIGKAVNLDIFDLSGKKVYNDDFTDFDNDDPIKLDKKLPSGLYMLKLTTKYFTGVSKLIMN